MERNIWLFLYSILLLMCSLFEKEVLFIHISSNIAMSTIIIHIKYIIIILYNYSNTHTHDSYLIYLYVNEWMCDISSVILTLICAEHLFFIIFSYLYIYILIIRFINETLYIQAYFKEFWRRDVNIYVLYIVLCAPLLLRYINYPGCARDVSIDFKLKWIYTWCMCCVVYVVWVSWY